MHELGAFKMGPFELMDLIGNDINYKVTETVWSQFYYDPRYKPSLTQKRMVEAGRSDGNPDRDITIIQKETSSAFIHERIMRWEKKSFSVFLVMLINEALDALYFKIASAEDIDLAMTKGVNYPKGLLKWCDELGAKNVLDILQSLYAEYQEERYRPGILLKQLASSDKKIFS